LAIVLILTLLFPRGMIDFEKFEKEDILIAYAEGAANCSTIIKLKSNYSFIERSVCFGVGIQSGTYKKAGDTIKLYYAPDNKLTIAVIKLNSTKINGNYGTLYRYKNSTDSLPYPLTIVKYALK
jgi:hypothetical protein